MPSANREPLRHEPPISNYYEQELLLKAQKNVDNREGGKETGVRTGYVDGAIEPQLLSMYDEYAEDNQRRCQIQGNTEEEGFFIGHREVIEADAKALREDSRRARERCGRTEEEWDEMRDEISDEKDRVWRQYLRTIGRGWIETRQWTTAYLEQQTGSYALSKEKLR